MQATPEQGPLIEESLSQVLPSQRSIISVNLVSLALIEYGCGRPEKSPEQINISGACTDVDIDAEISKYFESRQEKIARLAVNPKKFDTPDKIPNNAQIFSSRFVNEIKDPCIHSTLKMIKNNITTR